MFNRARYARSWWLVLVVMLLLVGAGCSGLPLQASWGNISLFGNPQQILFSYDDRIVQIDPTNGQPTQLRDADGTVRVDDQGNARVWRLQVTSGGKFTFFTQPITLNDTTLLITAYENKLFQVDPSAARFINPDGTHLPGHIVATPVLNGNLLYVPLTENNLIAWDLDTNQVQWTLETERGVWTSPLLLNGVLYVASMDHFLYALNAETGEQMWKIDLGGAVASTPVYANDHLYVGSFADKLFKITLDGTIVSTYATHEWLWGPPSVVGDQVYLADLAGYVYALQDAGDSFTELWSRQVAERGIRPAPLVTDDALIVGSRDHYVYWVSRETGEEIQKREMKGEILSDLLLLQPSDTLKIQQPLVIVSTLAHEELLVAFTVNTGERIWAYGI